jgi:hypothetical protein
MRVARAATRLTCRCTRVQPARYVAEMSLRRSCSGLRVLEPGRTSDDSETETSLSAGDSRHVNCLEPLLDSEKTSRRTSDQLRNQMHHISAVVGGEALGDERAVAGLRVALDTEQRRAPIGRQ